MCGIAGIYGKGNIKQMTDALIHRGPDGEGFYNNQTVSLGVRRLEIIAIETGNQPIYNEDRTQAIIFNGEIYNYNALRKTLKNKGHLFSTLSDTEIIIHAYEEWDVDCLSHLNGIFAFAIYNKNTKKLFIARDRLGVKPLYWSFVNNNLYFASEIKAILTQYKSSPELTEDFFCFETPLFGKTLFKNINSLLPAHYLIFDGTQIKIKRYWEINIDERYAKRDLSELSDELQELITDSVTLQNHAEVPIGVFISGGLDSTLLTYLSGQKKLFTCSYQTDSVFDEYKYAAFIAKETNAELHTITPTAKEFEAEFKNIIYHLDHPIATASSFSEFMLAKKARGLVKVVLGGQGADELFAGYARYLIYLAKNPLKIKWLKDYSALINFYSKKEQNLTPVEKYFYLIKRGPFPECINHLKPFFQDSVSALNSICLSDIALSLPSLLTMNDRAASAYGLENRTPFLDHRIVEFAFNIPDNFKINRNTTKFILKQASKNLIPKRIINRKDKKGLVTPVNIWLNNELKSWKNNLISKIKKRGFKIDLNNSRGLFDRNLYNLISLEMWFENFFPDYER
ncbi:MAG: hypothetical protein ACD_79C00869G0005 [uncultured bacterium]|nr:MAG: hypothetical protein ACD_79C00869G0005 [uncultured bacterium]